MVTKKELAKMKFEPRKSNKTSYKVSREELNVYFDEAAELPSDVFRVIEDYCEKLGMKYEATTIANFCHVNQKSLREYINGSRTITRKFLYKLTIGLDLDKDQANALFIKCGGELDGVHCLEDYIVLRAIEDGDDIEDFIKNYNEFVPDGSKLK
jgi:hypothetical protein